MLCRSAAMKLSDEDGLDPPIITNGHRSPHGHMGIAQTDRNVDHIDYYHE